jgi:hypothetical protein
MLAWLKCQPATKATIAAMITMAIPPVDTMR